MTNSDFMANLLGPYKPQLPIDELVVRVNNLFHAFEAQDYDIKHPEVYTQLPPLWREMIQACCRANEAVWRILNFGCGTGFEAEQLLRNLPIDRIRQVTCYDPSPEMLDRCRSRIAPLFPDAVFCSDVKALPTRSEPYTLLATNSLLHHLPDPVAEIEGLSPLLAPDAIWLAGHEPSSRFYKNVECLSTYQRFLQERRWRKYLSPQNYTLRLKRAIGSAIDPAKQAANEAFRQGLFGQKPSAKVIGLLVDLHVVRSCEEATEGRGFDFEMLQDRFAGSWSLIWVKTYSFMGAFYEGRLPKRWRRVAHRLARDFPRDGANFSAVWRRS